MSTDQERMFVVGATGDIGSQVVRGLVKRGIATTAYVRDEAKAKKSFQSELTTGRLSVVVGTYASTDVFAQAIGGHSRLFLLVLCDFNRPTSMSEVKEALGKIAYDKGVRQIVDMSSFTVRSFGKQGILGYLHTTGEEKLWKLADESPDTRSLVILRPGVFMSNQLMSDTESVRHVSKLLSPALPSSMTTWIDTKGQYHGAQVADYRTLPSPG